MGVKKSKQFDNSVMDAWAFLLRYLNLTLAMRFRYQSYKRNGPLLGELQLVDVRHDRMLREEIAIIVQQKIDELGKDNAMDAMLAMAAALERWIGIEPNAAILAADKDPKLNDEFGAFVKQVFTQVVVDECAKGAMIV